MKRRNAPNPTRDRILSYLADHPGVTRPEVGRGIIRRQKEAGEQLCGGPEMTRMRIIQEMQNLERGGQIQRDGNRWRLAKV